MTETVTHSYTCDVCGVEWGGAAEPWANGWRRFLPSIFTPAMGFQSGGYHFCAACVHAVREAITEALAERSGHDPELLRAYRDVFARDDVHAL